MLKKHVGLIALLEPPMSQTKGRGTGRYGNCGASNAELSEYKYI
jgi:hypothetical protein